MTDVCIFGNVLFIKKNVHDPVFIVFPLEAVSSVSDRELSVAFKALIKIIARSCLLSESTQRPISCSTVFFYISSHAERNH